jgi:lysophospholipase L1-like esterase
MISKLFTKSAPFLALLGLALTGCQPDLENDIKPSSGTADFTTYIAVGNSLTAGVSDAGLTLEGQQNSFPALLAQQFRAVGGGNFVQPLFSQNASNGTGKLAITGFGSTGSPLINTEVRVNNQFVPFEVFAPGRAFVAANSPLMERYTGTDNQNLGVPYLRVAEITMANYGRYTPPTVPTTAPSVITTTFNAHFERLLSGTDSKTYLQYVEERVATLKPTFFTNALGNNDVLRYATSGGTGTPLTTVADFTTKYNQLIDALTATGAKGIVTTIPNVTSLPQFTTVPTAGVIAQINATPIPAALVPLIAAQLGLPAGSPLPTGTRFALYVRTGVAATDVRLATPADLLLLTASGFINSAPVAPNVFPGGIGLEIPNAPAATARALAASSNAVPNNLVLDATEAASVATRTGQLNAVIVASAQRKGLAVFDGNSYFDRVARNGVVSNGVSNNASFVTGNFISLDGVHPTPRGYALIANEMIRIINQQYGASVPTLNPNDYRGVKFP